MKKLNVGDIFAMSSINDENDPRIGFGQIIKIPKKTFIVVIYKIVCYDQDFPSLDKILNSEILFLSYTTDALFHHKYWQVIGNSVSNLDMVKTPYYKLGLPPDMYIVNYKGDRLRKASQYEFDNLDYETLVAPVRFENALKLYYEMGEWDKDYDELLYERVIESIKVVEGK
jgi:Immunity protein 26